MVLVDGGGGAAADAAAAAAAAAADALLLLFSSCGQSVLSPKLNKIYIIEFENFRAVAKKAVLGGGRSRVINIGKNENK